MDNKHPWDDRYAISEYYYGTEPNDFLKENTPRIKPGGKVLCLAEGEGRNAVFLAKLGFEVTAVDQSSVGLKKMNELAGINGVTIHSVVADLADFNIEKNDWDGIVSIWCHVPPLLRKRLHRSIVGGLKEDGVLILESYHPRQLQFKTGGPPVAELMMTVPELKIEFDSLRFDLAQEVDREVHEGRGHFGMSAVTQLIATKKVANF